MEDAMTIEERQAIDAQVTAALAPLKAKVEALGRAAAARARDAELAEQETRQARKRYVEAYVEGRLGAESDTVQ